MTEANARKQEEQQELSETLSTPNNENENTTVILNGVDNSATSELPHTTTQTEATPGNKTQESIEGDSVASEALSTDAKTEADNEENKRKPSKDKDEEKQESEQEKNKGRTEDSDENKENSNKSSNTNPQLVKPLEDDKPKTIWKIKFTQEPIIEDSTPAPDKTTNSDTSTEGEEKSQQSSNELKSLQSPAQINLLANDPLVVKNASDLIERLKAQSNPCSPRE